MTTSTYIERRNKLRRFLWDKLGLVRYQIILTFIVLFCGTNYATANELQVVQFQVSLIGGSVITVDVAADEFAWTKVLSDGEMIKEKISFANVEQLVLSDSPASEQVSEIRQLVSMLSSPDYLDRQSAEEKLSDPKIGGNFKTMIKSQADNPKYEVRYRVARILDKLEMDDGETNKSEFDRLVLKNGTVVEGDAGKFRLDCTFRGREMVFSRQDIRLIAVPVHAIPIQAANSQVQVEMFHNHVDNFYLPHQTNVDFEIAPNGAEIRRNANVDEMFAPVGLKLGTEQEGYVGISGYGFKFPDKPATINSVCVFETIGTYSKRFKGVMELTFCMPNQKSVSAGVNEIGLLMARVNHSRDFIVEAYNADGQILASVESSDQPCVFAGVKSNEPIAKIRILSNPYLFRIDRGIDEDYAVDSICFSPPVPISRPRGDTQPTVKLTNGDLIQGDSINILDNNSISIEVPNNKPIEVDLEEVQSLHFVGPKKQAKKEKTWTAMLDDRSTIFVTPGESFDSSTFPSLKFKPEELMGLWSTQNPARFPEASDFDKGNKVVVFPTCRIAASSVEFSSSGFEWEKSAKKLVQPLQIDGDEKADEDPTPSITKVQYSKTWPENIPTIWMHSPKSQPNGTGRLRLVDGQQLVLTNGSGRFQLTKLDKNEVTISVAGKQHRIPLGQVQSIEFPIKPSP